MIHTTTTSLSTLHAAPGQHAAFIYMEKIDQQSNTQPQMPTNRVYQLKNTSPAKDHTLRKGFDPSPMDNTQQGNVEGVQLKGTRPSSQQ